MTSIPKDAQVGSNPPSGLGTDAAGGSPVRAPVARDGTGGAGYPLASPVLPAPDHSGAEGGPPELPPAPVRAPAVATPCGQGTPSRSSQREGTAGPAAPVAGPAQTSPSAAEGTAGGARDGEAGVRTLRASLPPATEPAGGTRRGDLSNTSPPAVQSPDLPVVARFTIDGEPAAKERARVVKRGPKTRGYTPEKTLHAEEVVGWKFRQAAPRHKLDAGKAYGVTALFFCGTRQRRDVDNMLKLVLDGLNGVAWPDDDQVTEVSARKALTVPGSARTEVVITEVPGGDDAA